MVNYSQEDGGQGCIQCPTWLLEVMPGEIPLLLWFLLTRANLASAAQLHQYLLSDFSLLSLLPKLIWKWLLCCNSVLVEILPSYNILS